MYLTNTKLKFTADKAQAIEVYVYRNFDHWLEGNCETALRCQYTEGKYRANDPECRDITVDVEDLFDDNFNVVKIISSYYTFRDGHRQHFYKVVADRDADGFVTDQIFQPVWLDCRNGSYPLPDC